MRRLRRSAVLAATVALATALLPGTAGAAPALQGGGSGFAALELNQWTADVARKPYNLTVNYAANSSGAGRANYANGVYQYGVSDIIYNPDEDGSLYTQAQQQHPYKYVTVSAGGLGMMYNLQVNGQQQRTLNLTRNEVCQIFTGELSMWNDPELVGTPGDSFLATVNQKIKPIIRGDSAGESFVLSQYCLAVDPGDWQTFINYVTSTNDGGNGYSDARLAKHLPISNWPPVLVGGNTATSASGADGVANDVQDNNVGLYGITYVAAGYAKVRNFPVASVEDGVANNFVQPNASTVQEALSYATPDQAEPGTFDLQFSANDNGAYFPSTYSYVIAPTTVSADVGNALATFLCYDVGAGQQEASALLYAPLSKQVVAISTTSIQAIPGSSSVSGCGTGGPAPTVAQKAPAASGAGTGSAAPSTGSTPASTGSTSTESGASGVRTGTGTAAASSNGVAGSATAAAAGGAGAAVSSSSDGQPGQAASGASDGEPGGTSSGGSLSSTGSGPLSAAPASSHGITNFSAVWWLLSGAVIAGLVASGRRRSAA